jgi:hypothetical protein
VADGTYCAQITLKNNGATVWQSNVNNFVTTNGAFTYVLAGAGSVSGTIDGATFNVATNGNALTVDVKIDYVTATPGCAGPTYTDNFLGIPIYAVPAAFMADQANGFSSSSTYVTPLTNGGTNASALTANGVVVSNAGGTALTTVAPGASNNVLISNGTSWTSGTVAPTTMSGAVTINSGGGTTTNIGDSTNSGTITIGSATTTQTINMGSGGAGSPTIAIGGDTGTSNVTIGSTNTAASVVALKGGTTGGVTINSGTGAAQPTKIGDGTTTGTITLGSATTTQTINIGAGGVGSPTIAIGTNTGTTAVSIGDTTAAGSTTTIKGGTGASAITLNAGAAGTVSIGSSASVQTIAIGNGAADTVNIGTAASTNISLGNGTGLIKLGNNGSTFKQMILCSGAGPSLNALAANTTSGTTNIVCANVSVAGKVICSQTSAVTQTTCAVSYAFIPSAGNIGVTAHNGTASACQAAAGAPTFQCIDFE